MMSPVHLVYDAMDGGLHQLRGRAQGLTLLQEEVQSYADALAAGAQREARGAAEQQRLAADASRLQLELRTVTEARASKSAARQVRCL